MADDSQSLPTDFDERFSDVYNRFTVPSQDTPLYTPKSSVIDFKKSTVKERFGGLPTEGPPEAFYTPPIERGKGGTLVEVPKKLREGNYELTPVKGNIAPGSLREVLFGYDKPVGRFQSWPERLARIVGKGAFNIVEAIPGGVTAPYEAYKGRLQVTDPVTGMPTEEAIQRSIAALSLPGGAGVIGGAEKGVVGAGPYLPNGVPKPEAFDRVLPAVRNLETGKISTTKRGDEHADILTRLWEREGGSSNADTMSIYEDMLPRHEMGYYDPLKKQFYKRDSEEWKNIDSPDLNPRKSMRANQVFSDTSKPGKALTAMKYRGEHSSPDLESGSPLHDVTANGTYPKDFYNSEGLRYYAPGHSEEADAAAYNKIRSFKDKPDEKVAIWRAIPWEGKGKNPLTRNSSFINPGDWVTINRQYAIDHGEAALNGNYQIAKAMVPAKELFTQGDSFHEWGWHPKLLSDTSKQAQLLSSLTASQRKAYNREAFRNGGQMLVPEASEEAIRKLVEEPAYKKWGKAANDAGFTTDAYHGTKNFEGSTIEPKRSGKTEFYSTDEPKLAEDYSGKSGGILPLKLNTKNYHIVDAHGKTWDQINEQVIKTAKEQGNSGVTIKNLRDSAADREVEPATVHITFDPSTVRSRFAKFNPEDVKKNGLLLSDSSKPAAMLAPAFHSAVENAVNNAKIKTGTPEQWLGYLKNQQGVKQEELDWIRPQDVPTNEKGQVSKEAMQNYVNSHKVELKEVERGDAIAIAAKKRVKEIHQRLEEIQDEYNKLYKQPDSAELAQYKANLTKEKSELYQESKRLQIEPQTKYSQYQLPGGSNYREKLLTLPNVKNEAVENFARDFYNNTKGEGGRDWQQLSQYEKQDWINAVKEQQNMGRGREDYQSSHWNEPNVLAHIRMNDRNIPGVGKSLHLEEIQSDWHQSGREKGYKLSQDDIRQKARIRKEDWNRMSQSQREVIEAGFPKSNEVPNAPFKKTWSDLALKRMIREASEKGYDAISWTPGEAQAARYNLSKQISHIDYIKNNENSYDIHAYDHNNKNVLSKEEVEPKELSNIIGKELSDKIVADKGKDVPTQDVGRYSGEAKRLSGLDLKIGGEGMKAFYDKMLVDKMNNLAKKYGGKVESKSLEDASKFYPVTDGNWWRIYNPVEENYAYNKRFVSKDEAQKAINEFISKDNVHVLKLPQSMKDAALEKGFPLFSKTGHILTPTSNPYINNENDVPYGAGASDTKSGYPVHIDKRIPETDPKLTLPSGEPANLHSYLQVHEITEHQLMKRGMSYEQAHKKATEREKAAVERDGVSWDEYSHIMSGYLKETEKEKVDNPPPNLYKRPYAHDRKELKKLEK